MQIINKLINFNSIINFIYKYIYIYIYINIAPSLHIYYKAFFFSKSYVKYQNVCMNTVNIIVNIYIYL